MTEHQRPPYPADNLPALPDPQEPPLPVNNNPTLTDPQGPPLSVDNNATLTDPHGPSLMDAMDFDGIHDNQTEPQEPSIMAPVQETGHTRQKRQSHGGRTLGYCFCLDQEIILCAVYLIIMTRCPMDFTYFSIPQDT